MERRVFQSEDGIEYHQVDRKIVENTKTPAGNRKIPLVKEAMDQELEKELTIPVQFTEKDNILFFNSREGSEKVIKGNQMLPA